MQINNFNPLRLINQNMLGKLTPGQTLFVEIINIKSSGEGIILLNDQELPAFMEISAKAGDKIWVKIQEINNNGLLLVREQNPDSLKITETKKEAQTILLERGLPKDANIIRILNDFNNDSQNYQSLLQKLSQESFLNLTGNQRSALNKILQAIPQWAGLGGKKGAEQILTILKALGIDYEVRLKEVVKPMRESQSDRLQELFSSLKPLIIKNLQDSNSILPSEHLNNLKEMLDLLTGQQLWLRTGDQENAYVLLNIPLQDNDHIFSAKVAIESTRKRNIMDIEHCHLALQIKTQVLGDVGADLWFYKQNLSLRLLTAQPDLIVPLVEQLLPVTKDRFSQIGFNLRSVETGNILNDQDFTNFISGRRKKGVDLII